MSKDALGCKDWIENASSLHYAGWSKMTYSVAGIEVIQRPMPPPETDNPPPKYRFHYEGLRPGSQVLPKGHQKSPGASKPLACDIRFDQDVRVALRDGTTIRVDIFRPAGVDDGAKIPAIMAWSVYGKSGVGFPNLEYLPFRACVPESQLSGYEKFEGPDPGFFCAHGYAVINADARGTWDSEGDMVWSCSQEGRDGADLVEWIGEQDWCSGKVGTAGNSWLARAQWHIASKQPKYLAAIAPWEGLSDFYRESFCRGGVRADAFWAANGGSFRGRSKMEDPFAMLDKYPLVNEYWEDKRAELSLITVPSYTLASYSTMLHTYGSVRGFREMSCKDKWLRFHPWQEWFDFYAEESSKDLLRFFDRYLKGVENGWESTPRVRLSLLRMDDQPPIINQPAEDYPVPDTRYLKYYLHNRTDILSPDRAEAEDITKSYDSTNREIVSWTMRFDEPTQLVGYSKLVAYMSCEEHDDMDVHLQLRKLNKAGEEMSAINYPMESLARFGVHSRSDVPFVNICRHLGPSGVLRASHREIDECKGTEFDPYHPHDKEDKIPPGQIVKLEIGFWPCGLAFEAGEGLKLCMSGYTLVLPEYPGLKEVQSNVGRHVVHSGTNYPSYLLLPKIEGPI